MKEKTAKPKGAARGSRPVLTRIYRIDRAVARGTCPGVAALAADLEVSGRTIERDLEQLRDFFGAPVVYDRGRGGYLYEGEFRLPPLRLTEGELTALLIGQRLLAELAGTPFAAAARQLLAKLPVLLDGEISVDAGHFGEEISFGLPRVRGDENVLGRHFNPLSAAVSHRRTVRLRYHTLTRDAVTERLVDPYHLRLEAGAWYLIGLCHLRGEIRVFAVDRIEELSLTDGTFVRPEGFSVEEFLGHSWSLERGQEHTVRVAFDAGQARWIRERTWQEGQRIEELPGGGLILEIKASGLGAIKRWILGFGRYAKVLEPEELARAIREEAEGILKSYE